MNERKCIKCNKELSKRQKSFCSNSCKLTWEGTTKQMNNKKPKNDTTKLIKSNIDGTLFNDINNLSGALTRHLAKHGISESNWLSYFTIIDNTKGPSPSYSCKYCDWTTKDTSNKSGCITVHLKKVHNISPTEHILSYPEESSFWTYTHSPELREHYLSQDPDQYVECQVCNQKFRSISQTHLDLHNISIDEYRLKYPDSPTKCKSYLDRAKELYELRFDQINHLTPSSKGEKEIESFLIDNGINIITKNRKILYPYELDIYLPDHNIAIEYNGLYYHSEMSAGKLKDYHVDKTNKCEAQGVKLIQIFEDEWLSKQDIIKARLLKAIGISSLKVYARKCIVKDIDPHQKNAFLSKYHLMGPDKCQISLGLFHNDELVSVMTFSNLRKALGYNSDTGSFELSRFASSIDIIGGASKLFNAFLSRYNPNIVISYADRRWTSTIHKSVYETIGFENKGVTKPNYWYTKSYHKRLHRFNFTKQRIVKEFNGDSSLTEFENMVKMGYDRIWDCGSIKYIYYNR